MLCSSGWWARRVEHELLPWGIGAVDLGDDVLEIGPGWLFKTIHIGDVLRPIDPDGLPQRLTAPG